MLPRAPQMQPHAPIRNGVAPRPRERRARSCQSRRRWWDSAAAFRGFHLPRAGDTKRRGDVVRILKQVESSDLGIANLDTQRILKLDRGPRLPRTYLERAKESSRRVLLDDLVDGQVQHLDAAAKQIHEVVLYGLVSHMLAAPG